MRLVAGGIRRGGGGALSVFKGVFTGFEPVLRSQPGSTAINPGRAQDLGSTGQNPRNTAPDPGRASPQSVFRVILRTAPLFVLVVPTSKTTFWRLSIIQINIGSI